MENQAKATSYKDLLKSFQQADNHGQTPRNKKLIYRPTQPKQVVASKKNK